MNPPAAMIKPRPIALRPETALSRRYLRVIEKWIPTGVRNFADWPVRPDCGHFLGGCHWYGIESVGGALAFAAAASSPEYDPAVGGVSRDELRTMARKAIRYLCFTHDSGPADCVRPAVGLGRKENWGTKWGERGLGFFHWQFEHLQDDRLVRAQHFAGSNAEDERIADLASSSGDGDADGGFHLGFLES